MVRELHTYGQMRPVGDRKLARSGQTAGKKAQHIGFGKRLMLRAEQISRRNGFKRIAVIAGIGTREYYKRRGYRLDGTYMVKDLPPLFCGISERQWALILAVVVVALAAIVGVYGPGIGSLLVLDDN